MKDKASVASVAQTCFPRSAALVLFTDETPLTLNSRFALPCLKAVGSTPYAYITGCAKRFGVRQLAAAFSPRARSRTWSFYIHRMAKMAMPRGTGFQPVLGRPKGRPSQRFALRIQRCSLVDARNQSFFVAGKPASWKAAASCRTPKRFAQPALNF